MAKAYKDKFVEVKWTYDLRKELQEKFSNEEWARQARDVVESVIKPKIAKGISPVLGERMFQKYKNPEKYPGNRKQNNKPNLFLSGSMLSNYGAFANKDPISIRIGMLPNTPEAEKIKAVANNEGTQSTVSSAVAKNTKHRKLKHQVRAASKGVPARPFIPKKNESFTSDIIIALRKGLAYCLDKALKKGK